LCLIVGLDSRKPLRAFHPAAINLGLALAEELFVPAAEKLRLHRLRFHPLFGYPKFFPHGSEQGSSRFLGFLGRGGILEVRLRYTFGWNFLWHVQILSRPTPMDQEPIAGFPAVLALLAVCFRLQIGRG